MTDADLLNTFSTSDQDICGRFGSWQLDRDLIPAERKQSFTGRVTKRLAASLLLLQSLTNVVLAQGVRPRTHTQQRTPATAAEKRRSVKGYVKDYLTQKPIPGIRLNIAGTDICDTAGKNGHFCLLLPDTAFPRKFSVTAAYTERSGGMPAGTIILPLEVNIDQPGYNGEIVVYRYPADSSKEETVRAPMESQTFIKQGGGMGFYLRAEQLPVRRRHWYWPFSGKARRNTYE